MENVWQFMRDNCLSNRLFRNNNDIIAHCCHAWNRLVDQRVLGASEAPIALAAHTGIYTSHHFIEVYILKLIIS